MHCIACFSNPVGGRRKARGLRRTSLSGFVRVKLFDGLIMSLSAAVRQHNGKSGCWTRAHLHQQQIL